MSFRKVVVGAGISLVMPAIIYLILLVLGQMMTRDTQDFQYHDSYFITMHVGWLGYLACSVALMIVYLIGLVVYRFVR